jgi:hypothetical protein
MGLAAVAALGGSSGSCGFGGRFGAAGAGAGAAGWQYLAALESPALVLDNENILGKRFRSTPLPHGERNPTRSS